MNNKLKVLLEEDPENFRSYVWQDIHDKGYFFWGMILSKKGRAARKECANAIDLFEASIDRLMKHGDKLLAAMVELGTNLIFLDAKTISKLRAFTKEHLLHPEPEHANRIGRLESIGILKTMVLGDFNIPNPGRRRNAGIGGWQV